MKRPRQPGTRTGDALELARKAAERAAMAAQQTDHVYGVREGAAFIAAWPARPSPILFLDFDGVLNCERSFDGTGERYRFGADNVNALNLILTRTEARIVITSTWRLYWSLRENSEFLERDGVLPGRVVGKTADLSAERGHEIDAWLKGAPFAVAGFVILDDRDDMAMHRPRLIQVESYRGLTMADAERAIHLLTPREHAGGP